MILFETEDLSVSELTPDDSVDFHRICNQQFVLRWMDDWEMDSERVKSLIEYFIKGYQIKNPEIHPYILALRLKSTNQFIGICGFGTKEELGGEAEIAYFIDELHSNKGYMSQAIEKSIDFYFEMTNKLYLSALVDDDNIPSKKLLVKNGFSYYHADDPGGIIKSHYRILRNRRKEANLTMKDKLNGLMNRCFSIYGMSIKSEVTDRLFENVQTNGHIISECSDDGNLSGISMIIKNSVLLLCVEPECQGDGIGGRLLKKSEELIKSNGYEKIILGRGDGYIMQGVPSPDDNRNAVRFFENHGYSASWESIDMSMNIENYTEPELDYPHNIIFRYAQSDDFPDLIKAVDSVDTGWTPYFTADSAPVLLAVDSDDGCIAGFEFVEDNISGFYFSDKKAGAVGCVGVVPDYREKGIGAAMVAKGTSELKKAGCIHAFIGYTYLESWYGKLGYKTDIHYWMGEK